MDEKLKRPVKRYAETVAYQLIPGTRKPRKWPKYLHDFCKSNQEDIDQVWKYVYASALATLDCHARELLLPGWQKTINELTLSEGEFAQICLDAVKKARKIS